MYFRNLADEFIRREEQITIFSAAEKGQSDNIESLYRGVSVHPVMSAGMDRNLLKDRIQTLAPDVVHAHGFKSLMATVCHELNIPCIVTVHHGGIVCPQGALLNNKDKICHKRANTKECLPCVLRKIPGGEYWTPILNIIPEKQRIRWGERIYNKTTVPYFTPLISSTRQIEYKLQEWYLLRDWATRFISPSDAMLRCLLVNGVRAGKLKLIPHGIPYVDTEPEQRKIRIEGDGIKFFYVGRLSYEKGVHILLKAFDRYTSLYPLTKSELHIIGGAETKTEIRYWEKLYNRYISPSAVPVRIFYHGKLPHNETLKLIQSFDVLIHPTICLEVYGLNIAEALMLKKPVIASRCGGAEAQIEEGINGYLYDPPGLNELTDLIAFAENNPSLIHRLSEKAPRKVISIRQHADELIEEYQSVLSNK